MTEPGVLSVSNNNLGSTPETDSFGQASVNGAALPNLFGSNTPVNFYGTTVLSGYINQPSAQLINVARAQSSFGAGTGIVAIIDTGVDTAHPGLQGSLIQGYDFTRNRPDTVSELNDLSPDLAAALLQGNVQRQNSPPGTPILAQSTVELLDQSTVELLDQSTVELLDGVGLPAAFGHGTMMAGLVHLVAPQARIMPLKAFASDGTAQLADVVSAIFYAADHGADVINMSFGFPSNSPLLSGAITYATSKGVLCVTSAGNEGVQAVQFPAGYAQSIAVGSTNLQDQRSSFSDYSGEVNAAAPGEGVITFFPGGLYAAGWGTSFSTALVSGTAALIGDVNPSLTLNGFKNSLAQGVPIDSTLGIGKARLDVFNAVNFWN
jgi:subtilisin family serine protease